MVSMFFQAEYFAVVKLKVYSFNIDFMQLFKHPTCLILSMKTGELNKSIIIHILWIHIHFYEQPIVYELTIIVNQTLHIKVQTYVVLTGNQWL